MATFQFSREICLMYDELTYIKPLTIPVTVADNAIKGVQRKTKDKKISYTIIPCDPSISKMMTMQASRCPPPTLEKVSLAAMRFYRTGGISQFEHEDFLDALFIHRYDWERVFSVNDNNSVGHLPKSKSRRHTEALLSNPEIFGYGLAIVTIAHIFGITTDRFFFISGTSKKRPDFAMRVTDLEMKQAGTQIGFIGTGGHKIFLEVKVRRCATLKPRNIIPLNVLQDMDEKAGKKAGNQRSMYVGAFISVPAPELFPNGVTRILLADPGEPDVLSETEQADYLLRELFFLGTRIGLWRTARRILEWLQYLDVVLTDNEIAYLERTNDLQGTDQERTLRRVSGNRTFRGRQFIRAMELGPQFRTGQIGRVQIETLLRSEDVSVLGPSTFRGLDVRMIQIIDRRDMNGLLSYGLRDNAEEIDISGESAYIELPLPLSIEEAMNVRNDLKKYLSPMNMETIDLADEF